MEAGDLSHQGLALGAGDLYPGTEEKAMGEGRHGGVLHVVGRHEVATGGDRQRRGHPNQGQGGPRGGTHRDLGMGPGGFDQVEHVGAGGREPPERRPPPP